jgi:thymidylate synthase
MLTVTAGSASSLWQQAVRMVLADGRPCDPRGLGTWEVTGAHLTLTSPRRRLVYVPHARVINAAFAAAETVWILVGTDDPWIYTYNERLRDFADGDRLHGAYGPRLRSWAGHIDQLDKARRQLLADPATRRAVIQLWDPARDYQGNRDVPCTLGYWFALRGGRLEMHTMMRSQDLWLGFCYDIFTATVVHELMAGWAGVEPGDYHHHAGSLHLYENHLPAARSLTVDGGLPDSPVMSVLALPWGDLDPTLNAVIEGRRCGHPGWDQMSDVMRSYRVYKHGDRADGRELAGRADGPLATALANWYAHLDQAAGLSAPQTSP